MNPDDLVVSPAGAAFLAGLEAVDIATQSVGRLLDIAVHWADRIAGPWTADAPESTAIALRTAPDRIAIAAAVVDRLGAELTAPGDPAGQEWWWSDTPFDRARADVLPPLRRPRPPSPAWVTATHSSLWTVTSPPDDIHDDLVDVWEIFPGPVTRWRLTPDPNARVFEVNGTSDWAELVRRYPLARENRPNTSWELPGPNQRTRDGVAELLAIPGQRAARSTMHWFVEPDWDAVAEDFDAVHLTWWGFLTAEGTIIDLGGGDVAMLRNWHSERTLWLNPVLADPVPLPAANLSGRISNIYGLDARDDPARAQQDRAWLRHKLGQ